MYNWQILDKKLSFEILLYCCLQVFLLIHHYEVMIISHKRQLEKGRKDDGDEGI